jgi:DNA-binding transcriptional MerR regulator
MMPSDHAAIGRNTGRDTGRSGGRSGGRLTIGRLSRESGCKVPTIRYYETIGLMPAPDRSAGNQRLYRPEHLERLSFIRHARDLGFTLDAIRELLALAAHPDAPCDRADAIARRHLDDVRERLRRLQLLEAELARMVEACAADAVADCRVIELLSDHGQCLTDRHPAVD